MTRINWGRFILGALIATIILFVTDGFFHERLVGADWKAIYDNLRAAMPEPHGSSLAYFFFFELGRGVLAMILYVLLRRCCRPGPKTAVLAGLIVWFAFSVTGPSQFLPLGFLSTALWMKMIAFHLITSIVAAIAGAAVYKENDNPDALPG